MNRLSLQIGRPFATATLIAVTSFASLHATDTAYAQNGDQPVQNNQAAQGDVITYTYPNGTQREFNTDVFWVEDGRVSLTQEAMMAIDINGQKLKGTHTRAEIAAENDEEKRNVMLSQNNMIYLRHLADQHGDSIKESIAIEVQVEQAKDNPDLRGLRRRVLDRYKRIYSIDTDAEVMEFINSRPSSAAEIIRLVEEELGLRAEANISANATLEFDDLRAA